MTYINYQVLYNPSEYGLTNITDPCWDGDYSGNGAQCANPEEYLFWDAIHPTAAAHLLIGEWASTLVLPDLPGAPTIGTATAGDAEASVSFTAPDFTGGSAITSYTVTSSPDGLTGVGVASPITVPGLANGQTFTFSVTATNSIGTGPASDGSNEVTPEVREEEIFINGFETVP